MKRKMLFAVVAHVAVIEGSATFAQMPRVVFYYLQARGDVSEPTRELFRDLIRERLSASRVLDCPSVGHVYSLFEKLSIPLDGCARAECAAKVGDHFNADKAVWATISRQPSGLVGLVGNVVDVRTAMPDFSTMPFESLETRAAIQAVVEQFVAFLEQSIKPVVSIVSVDPSQRTATINCGGLHGIRPGQVFDVLRKLQVGVRSEELVLGSATVLEVAEAAALVRLCLRGDVSAEVGDVLRARPQ